MTPFLKIKAVIPYSNDLCNDFNTICFSPIHLLTTFPLSSHIILREAHPCCPPRFILMAVADTTRALSIGLATAGLIKFSTGCQWLPSGVCLSSLNSRTLSPQIQKTLPVAVPYRFPYSGIFHSGRSANVFVGGS